MTPSIRLPCGSSGAHRAADDGTRLSSSKSLCDTRPSSLIKSSRVPGPVKGNSRLPSPIRADQVEELGRSARKRAAILSAATDVFLKGGYLGTNVDAIAAGSGVSKQTVNKHFGSKEALFLEIVASMTSDAADLVVRETPEPDDSTDLAGYLRAYAEKQLTVVLTPRLMQLRRLVIGEVCRFPDLAKVCTSVALSAR